MRVLLDTNVVLDSLLFRAPWNMDADEILRRSQAGVLEVAVSALSIANIFYIGRKLVGVARARKDVRTCLSAFELVPINRRVLEAPDASLGPDYEDNLQIAAAVYAKLDLIVTRNVSHFTASPIRVMTPPQLLAMLIP